MGSAGLMRLEAEAKNSSEKERMREVRGAETRSANCQQWFRAAGVNGAIDQGVAKGCKPLEMGRRELYQYMWCRRCCLFGPTGWNRWGRTGCPEWFRGRVLVSPFFRG